MRLLRVFGFVLYFVALQMVAVGQGQAAGQRTLVRVGKMLDVRTGKEPAAQTLVVVGGSGL